MTNRELIRLLGTRGYRKVTLETDRGESKTFYTYRRGLHINATKNLSFTSYPNPKVLGWGGLPSVRQKTEKAPNWEQTGRSCFFHDSSPYCKGKPEKLKS